MHLTKRVKTLLLSTAAAALLAGCGTQTPPPQPPPPSEASITLTAPYTELFTDEPVTLEAKVTGDANLCTIKLNGKTLETFKPSDGTPYTVPTTQWVYGTNVALISCQSGTGTLSAEDALTITKPRLTLTLQANSLDLTLQWTTPKRPGTLDTTIVYTDATKNIFATAYAPYPDPITTYQDATSTKANTLNHTLSAPLPGQVQITTTWKDQKGHTLTDQKTINIYDTTNPIRIFAEDGTEITNSTYTVPADAQYHPFGIIFSSQTIQQGDPYVINVRWTDGGEQQLTKKVLDSVNGVIGNGTFAGYTTYPVGSQLEIIKDSLIGKTTIYFQ